jgi:SAM-dependent methyltransferase
MPVRKIFQHITTFGVTATLRKVLAELPSYVANVRHWRMRRCGCCQKWTVFVCNGPAREFHTCIWCSANERYELLAAEIREKYGAALAEMEVLELDPNSPLRRQLAPARRYVRTFYDAKVKPGSVRGDGTVCQDLTRLTFPNESFDLIISSDVLEHIPDLRKAFHESWRVLRPGKSHLFTVPPRRGTRRRAEVLDGEIVYLETPEYHRDPLRADGVLAFWDLGPDLDAVFGWDQLRFRVARGNWDEERRVVWTARRELGGKHSEHREAEQVSA